ncbi:tRNA (guanosine(37)-N1)-methyltransferase TrmD [Phycicoccus sp. Root101]|uniref:tRNA (guanosine(37)-N1)-methyltransferase TrmD n=1 Tax=Phycicoccus sp. Root101 TaxID=1736421 RepID=UPI0007023D04|nr:tRNA (guanosine(37)-N1)-methyltransferase TrmD [Phycicoccus sp. Root101]KQU70584.1 transposase [Phycicoccus sp. Root101]
MRLDVVSIFPEYLAPLDLSLIGKARRDGLLHLQVHDLREFAHDRHRTVDDTPYGGGAGMVMKPEPWAEALAHVAGSAPASVPTAARPRLIVPGPGGVPFTQALARELADEPWLAFACGRYEGIDERVHEHAAQDLGLEVTVVSLGDYVLNGGEVAVLAIVEAVARLLPGVIGNAESLVEESHEDGLLEYPVYTKPSSWESAPGVRRDVPAVLLSGDHGRIAAWRHQQRLERTAARRPDLLHASQAAPAAPGGPATNALDGFDVALATPADAPELLTLSRACWVTEGRANDSFEIPPLVETLEEVVYGLTQWLTWMVRSEGRLVGSVRGRRDPEDPATWQVGRLMVAPDLQGRGLGRALLAHAEAAAPADVVTYWVNTGQGSERNLRTYRKAGYRAVPGEGSYPGTVDLTKARRGSVDEG